jgi:hypothetical protein
MKQASFLGTLLPMLPLVLLLAGCSAPPAATGHSGTATSDPYAGWFEYRDTVAGFSILIPPDWRMNPGGPSPQLFTLDVAPGTRLMEKVLDIQTTTDTSDCRESNYIDTEHVATSGYVDRNGIHFFRQTGAFLGANNIFEWTAYSSTHGMHCLTLTFVLHSSNQGVYSTEPAQFDKTAESHVFDQMLDTLRFGP